MTKRAPRAKVLADRAAVVEKKKTMMANAGECRGWMSKYLGSLAEFLPVPGCVLPLAGGDRASGFL
jgi:hypothetical protein